MGDIAMFYAKNIMDAILCPPSESDRHVAINFFLCMGVSACNVSGQ